MKHINLVFELTSKMSDSSWYKSFWILARSLYCKSQINEITVRGEAVDYTFGKSQGAGEGGAGDLKGVGLQESGKEKWFKLDVLVLKNKNLFSKFETVFSNYQIQFYKRDHGFCDWCTSPLFQMKVLPQTSVFLYWTCFTNQSDKNVKVRGKIYISVGFSKEEPPLNIHKTVEHRWQHRSEVSTLFLLEAFYSETMNRRLKKVFPEN